MYRSCSKSIEILFALLMLLGGLKQAVFLVEVLMIRILLHDSEARGRPLSLLRMAYEARQRALTTWEASRTKPTEAA